MDPLPDNVIPFPAHRMGAEPYQPILLVQQQLGVSRRTVERWIAEGMESRLVEGRRVVRLSDAREWRAIRKQEAS